MAAEGRTSIDWPQIHADSAEGWTYELFRAAAVPNPRAFENQFRNAPFSIQFTIVAI